MKGTKTQTRRDSPKYQTGQTYAIQPGRGKPGDRRGRILITHMWIENAYTEKGEEFSIHPLNAEAEGGYTPEKYEMLYEGLHPLWETRYVYEFEFLTMVQLMAGWSQRYCPRVEAPVCRRPTRDPVIADCSTCTPATTYSKELRTARE